MLHRDQSLDICLTLVGSSLHGGAPAVVLWGITAPIASPGTLAFWSWSVLSACTCGVPVGTSDALELPTPEAEDIWSGITTSGSQLIRGQVLTGSWLTGFAS